MNRSRETHGAAAPPAWLVGIAAGALFGLISAFPFHPPFLEEAYGYVLVAGFLGSALVCGLSRFAMLGDVSSDALSLLLLVALMCGMFGLPHLYRLVLFAAAGVLIGHLTMRIGWFFSVIQRPEVCVAFALLVHQALYLSSTLVVRFYGAYWQVPVLVAGLVGFAGIKTLGRCKGKTDTLSEPALAREGLVRQRRALIALGVVALLGSLADSTVYWGAATPGGFSTLTLTSQSLCYVFAGAASAFWVYHSGHLGLATFSLSVLGLGFAVRLLGAQLPFAWSAGSYLLSIGLAGTDMFYWVSVCLLARQFGARRTLGVALGVYVGCIIASSVFVNAGFGSGAGNAVADIVVIAALFLSIPYVLNHVGATHDTYTEIAEPAPKPVVSLFAKPLTPAENRVFDLLCLGKSDPEIARSLTISRSTVKFHVRNILRKAGVDSRKRLLAEIVHKNT